MIWWLTFAGCALFAVDDVAVFRGLGGGLLASPGWLPIIIAGFLASRDPRFRRLRLSRVIIAVFSYGILITLITLPFLAADVLGENPIAKSIKVAVSVGVWLLMLVSGAILSRVVPRAVQAGAIAAIATMTLGALLYHLGYQGVDQNELIHSYQNLQQRVRSTRFEASSLGAGLIVCLGLIAMRSTRTMAVVLFPVGLIMIGVVAESRGTNLTIYVSLLVIPFLIWLKSRKADLTANVVLFWASVLAALAVVSSFRLDYFLGSALWSELGLKTEGTSDASRSMWADASLAAVGQHPLGMGYAAYLEWLPKLVENSTRSALDFFPIRDLSEMINQSFAASDATLSPKNLVGIAAVFLGAVGVAMVGILYAATIKNSIHGTMSGESNRLIVGVSLVIVSSTYYTSIFSMDQAFLFGALAWGSDELLKMRDGRELTQAGIGSGGLGGLRKTGVVYNGNE
ncbi:hypothetical protein AB4089_13410 [Arthrobacter sp. 2MCAF15]|uniref:hypothetical protein n=1 Tax=Arthrobacter sp. 2MCAF15 TaxID=3232984 RepID=UPI003F8EC8D0